MPEDTYTIDVSNNSSGVGEKPAGQPAGNLSFFKGDKMIDFKKIPREKGYYLAGFADGEGSFIVSVRKRKDYKIGWKISVCFNVSQKDRVILSQFKRYLQCGSLRMREDGVWYYEVNNFRSIVENVIPFFEKFGFLSSKKKNDFRVFKQIVELIKNNEHLTHNGIQKILSLRAKLNKNSKKEKYKKDEILKNIEKGKGSSETIRQAF